MAETGIPPFWWGCVGSAAVELIAVVRIHESGKPLPVRYRRLSYFIVRLMLVGLGGMIAMGYGLDNPIAALHIGASAPLLIDSFTRTHPGPPPPRADQASRQWLPPPSVG